MKKRKHFISAMLIGTWMTFAMALAYAGAPLWTFIPLTSTRITIAANDTATVQYQVTNQSRKPHTLMIKAIPGVTQITTPGNCPNSFALNYQQSCILNLSINGSELTGNISGGPVVCQQGSFAQCYQPSSIDSLQITKGPTTSYTVGGSVVGLLGTLTLENNGSDALTMNADGTFSFSNPLPPGSYYQVTVQNQPASQTCTVTNGNGTITSTNITNVTVNCSTNTRSIGGTISGLTGTVVLQNNGGDNLSRNSNGSFTFSTPVAQGAPYNVTVLTQPAGQTCSVTNGSGTAGSSNITNIQVTCSTNAFTVGGTISGLSGTVILQNNGADNLSQSSNGGFTFSTPVAQGATYNVTVSTQPAIQTCTVNNGSGTMGGSNVTNVGVNCVTNSTTLTTSISDLALSVTGLTEYGISGTPSSGLARVITVTNTGSNPAVNLSVNAPSWPFGTSNSTTCGSTLGAGNSCTITITPGNTATSNGTNPCSNGTAPVPQAIQVTADNATTVSTNVVVLGYGCIYQGGYVFAFDDTTSNNNNVAGKVATTSDQVAPYPNGIVWSSNGGTGGGSAGNDNYDVSFDVIPGTDETSTSSVGSPTYAAFTSFFADYYSSPNPFTSGSFNMCNGAIDGNCNTNNIMTFYNQLITNNIQGRLGTPPPFSFVTSPGPTDITYYATGLCKQTISSHSDWYLPAICEMGYGSTPCGNSSTPTLQNMYSSLRVASGVILSGEYWSSTQWFNASFPQVAGWYQSFSVSSQNNGSKAAMRGVRCARAF